MRVLRRGEARIRSPASAHRPDPINYAIGRGESCAYLDFFKRKLGVFPPGWIDGGLDYFRQMPARRVHLVEACRLFGAHT